MIVYLDKNMLLYRLNDNPTFKKKKIVTLE